MRSKTPRSGPVSPWVRDSQPWSNCPDPGSRLSISVHWYFQVKNHVGCIASLWTQSQEAVQPKHQYLDRHLFAIRVILLKPHSSLVSMGNEQQYGAGDDHLIDLDGTSVPPQDVLPKEWVRMDKWFGHNRKRLDFQGASTGWHPRKLRSSDDLPLWSSEN